MGVLLLGIVYSDKTYNSQDILRAFRNLRKRFWRENFSRRIFIVWHYMTCGAEIRIGPP